MGRAGGGTHAPKPKTPSPRLLTIEELKERKKAAEKAAAERKLAAEKAENERISQIGYFESFSPWFFKKLPDNNFRLIKEYKEFKDYKIEEFKQDTIKLKDGRQVLFSLFEKEMPRLRIIEENQDIVVANVNFPLQKFLATPLSNVHFAACFQNQIYIWNIPEKKSKNADSPFFHEWTLTLPKGTNITAMCKMNGFFVVNVNFWEDQWGTSKWIRIPIESLLIIKPIREGIRSHPNLTLFSEPLINLIVSYAVNPLGVDLVEKPNNNQLRAH